MKLLHRYHQRKIPELGKERSPKLLYRGCEDQIAITREGCNGVLMNQKVGNVMGFDSEDYGAPPEDCGIILHRYSGKHIPLFPFKQSGVRLSHGGEDVGIYYPQAWETVPGRWRYNLAGALALVNAIGRTLPTLAQLISAIKENPDYFIQDNDIEYYCSDSSPHDRITERFNTDGARFVYFGRNSVPHIEECGVYHRFFVRFMTDMK